MHVTYVPKPCVLISNCGYISATCTAAAHVYASWRKLQSPRNTQNAVVSISPPPPHHSAASSPAGCTALGHGPRTGGAPQLTRQSQLVNPLVRSADLEPSALPPPRARSSPPPPTLASPPGHRGRMSEPPRLRAAHTHTRAHTHLPLCHAVYVQQGGHRLRSQVTSTSAKPLIIAVIVATNPSSPRCCSNLLRGITLPISDH
jgi:hypothetical protein